MRGVGGSDGESSGATRAYRGELNWLELDPAGAEADADLNDANHFELPPEIAGVAEWRDRRRAYLATLVRDGATVDDAITGRQLRIDDQLLEIALEAYAEGDDELRAYAEEDCDWTPCGADAFEKFQDSFVFSRGASAPSEMQCGSSYNSIVLALRAPL